MPILHFWPQLLVLAIVFARVLIGLCRALGVVEFKERKSSPAGLFFNGLLWTAITQYVLWAGGFYAGLARLGGNP